MPWCSLALKAGSSTKPKHSALYPATAWYICPEAWYLERAGAARSSAGARRLQAGSDAHHQIGRRTDNLHALDSVRQVLLMAILVLVVVVAAQIVSARGLFGP
jgi:hypothetical protein